MSTAHPTETPLGGRLPTGVHDLDAILGGGLFTGAIYMVAGRPGAGKTILSNQIAFHHARDGGRVVYATLLAETHERLLAQLESLSFFDKETVGRGVTFLNGLGAMLDGGLPALLQLVRRMVRDHGASLLVLDGLVTAAQLAPSELDYKRFISELQTWVGMVGCTVILVTSSPVSERVAPEHTMVDGIIELSSELEKLRSSRRLTVTKFRGGAFVEGSHPYVITPGGLRVFSRFEARVVDPAGQNAEAVRADERVSIGVPGLDPALGGGLVRGSTTLALSPSGCGKTIMGLQFLSAGAEKHETGLYFGFFEPPPVLLAKGDRLGFRTGEAASRGAIFVEWRRPAELVLDALADDIIRAVDQHGVKRFFLDGFASFSAAADSHRVAPVFTTLASMLSARGVTTMISDESRELYIQNLTVPTPGVSAIFHNIVVMRQIEVDGGHLERAMSILKTRDSAHQREVLSFDITDKGMRVLGRRRNRTASLVTKSSVPTPDTTTSPSGNGGRRRTSAKKPGAARAASKSRKTR
jgi:circadian clock protein KaiC